MNSFSNKYAEAGVDVTRGYEAVRLMKDSIARTHTPGVLGDVGGFGGLFQPDLTGMKAPVLVSGTDGVGTKLKIAFSLDKHDTVGIDCVAMCVNDVLCCGAKPLFFLDYLATGRNVPEKVAKIVGGVAEGCVQAHCALIGGETAEMPGFYPYGEYDLAGFCVGVVDREKILDNSSIRAGDVLIALPSSGVHSNGFSLIRRLFPLDQDVLAGHAEELGAPLGETLLTPTRIYVRPVLRLLEAVPVKGLSHITGGGFFENVPRSLPGGLMAKVEKAALKTPPIFSLIQRAGGLSDREMFNVYNMGVGMCAVVAREDADRAIGALLMGGVDAYPIGEVAEGNEGVRLC